MYSIVIPTFNSAKFIANTVNEIYTIASKELLVFEIIIINDFSKDNTEDVLKKLENKYSNLLFLSLEENQGQVKATIKGIEKSKGTVIISIDDDLEFDFSSIKTHVKNLDTKDLIYLYSSKYKHSFFKFILHKIYNLFSINYNGVRVSSFRIFKRELIGKSLFLNQNIKHHSLDFYLLEKAKQILCLPVKYQSKNKSRYSTLGLIKIYSIGLTNFLLFKKRIKNA